MRELDFQEGPGTPRTSCNIKFSVQHKTKKVSLIKRVQKDFIKESYVLESKRYASYTKYFGRNKPYNIFLVTVAFQ